jgi:hypothetical protein
VVLVGGVVVWLAGHPHLSCLNLRQWIITGVDMHSFIPSVQWSCCCCVALALVLLRLSMRLLLLLATAALLLLLTWLDPNLPATVHVDACALLCTFVSTRVSAPARVDGGQQERRVRLCDDDQLST